MQAGFIKELVSIVKVARISVCYADSQAGQSERSMSEDTSSLHGLVLVLGTGTGSWCGTKIGRRGIVTSMSGQGRMRADQVLAERAASLHQGTGIGVAGKVRC